MMTRRIAVLAALLPLLAGGVGAQPPSGTAGQEHTAGGEVRASAQSSQERMIAGILEAMIRDLRAEIRELRRELLAEIRDATNESVEESRRVVREGLDDTRRLYLAIQSRLDGIAVEVGAGETREFDTIYQAESAGLVVAESDTGSNAQVPRGIIVGYAASEPETLRAPVDGRYLRGSASIQYRGLDTYLPHDSMTFPVRNGEFWVVRAGSRSRISETTRIKFYPIKLEVGD